MMMEKLFNEYKGKTFKLSPEGLRFVCCGYREDAFIMAIETTNKNYFRRTDKDTFILEFYKDPRFRYRLADESELTNGRWYAKI